MKAVILAGGLGTRISEESHLRPKPMIEIGGRPILWHIMKIFSAQGVTDFVICCGYKGNLIKEYFSHYALYHSDVTFDYRQGEQIEICRSKAEPWRVTLVDTGLMTQTGGRLKRVGEYVAEEPFFMTYGDGVADVDLKAVQKRHEETGAAVTMTLVQPEGRFGVAEVKEGRVTAFREKDQEDSGWVNGGFMVVSPRALSLVEGDDTVWEREPLERMAAAGEIAAYCHQGFWMCMDTARDRNRLEEIWKGGAPWKIWRD